MGVSQVGRGMEHLLDPEEGALHRSCLFTVRVWPEYLNDGRTEWRGQVQHVVDHETLYFREWSALVSFLERKLLGFQRQVP